MSATLSYSIPRHRGGCSHPRLYHSYSSVRRTRKAYKSLPPLFSLRSLPPLPTENPNLPTSIYLRPVPLRPVPPPTPSKPPDRSSVDPHLAAALRGGTPFIARTFLMHDPLTIWPMHTHTLHPRHFFSVPVSCGEKRDADRSAILVHVLPFFLTPVVHLYHRGARTEQEPGAVPLNYSANS